MIPRIAVLALLAATSLSAGTLRYATRGGEVTLQREGDRIVLRDGESGRVLASARASAIDRVRVTGAASADDTLTIDLTEPIVLPRGIDYDGGPAGWDTLVLRGGSARDQRVTQLSPSDGVIDIDGLVVRYANLEPITDTAPAANFTITGTAGTDTVTFTNGPGGTTMVSSPTFESVTFANKTNVVFDGLGGGDSVSFNNPTPATGLQSLIVTNVNNVFQSARIAYPALGINASGFVSFLEATNDVDRVEITTQNGHIVFIDADDLIVGGVSSSLAGVRAVQSGSVSVQALGGTLTLADTDGAEIVRSGAASGSVQLYTAGASSDLVVTVDRRAAVAPAGGVGIQTGRDVLLGTGGVAFANDIRGASVSITTARFLTIAGLTTIAGDGPGSPSTGAVQLIPFNTMTVSGGAQVIATASGAGVVITGGPLVFTGTVPAVSSTSGDITLNASGLTIAPTSGLSAAAGKVIVHAFEIDLGTVADVPGMPVEVSDAEIDRIQTPVLEMEALSGLIAVTQPVSFNGELVVRTSSSFTATGAGSLQAQTLTLHVPNSTPKTWTITPTTVQISGGTPVPYTATTLNASNAVLSWFNPNTGASDTYFVAPSATTTINIDGDLPAPPALPGDTLDFDLAGTTAPVLTFTSTSNGYQGTLASSNRLPVNFQRIETLRDTPVDFRITKTDAATTRVAGTSTSYTITVTNPGPFPATGVQVTDSFPPSLTAVSWTCTAAAGSSCAPSGSGDLNATVSLGANSSVTYSVTATIASSATGTLTNTATVTTPGGFTETNAANNSATDSTALTTDANLVLTKSTGAGTVLPGDIVSYTIALRNAGPSDANTVSLTDAIPAHTTFVSLSSAPGYTCTTPAVNGTGTVTCTVAVLPPSPASDVFFLSVRVNATAPPAAVITNTATATTTTSSGSPAASASASVTVAGSIPLLSPAMLAVLIALLAGCAYFAAGRITTSL